MIEAGQLVPNTKVRFRWKTNHLLERLRVPCTVAANLAEDDGIIQIVMKERGPFEPVSVSRPTDKLGRRRWKFHVAGGYAQKIYLLNGALGSRVSLGLTHASVRENWDFRIYRRAARLILNFPQNPEMKRVPRANLSDSDTYDDFMLEDARMALFHQNCRGASNEFLAENVYLR